MTFKLISIWNPKGGQGKSMIAINLAAAAVEMGLKPLVIDQDQQGTSHETAQNGKLPFDVISRIPDNKPDANLVIIDHQASDWELPRSKTILMPVKPDRTQYKTYAVAKKRAEQAGKQVYTVVTDAQHQRPEQKATVQKLVENGAVEIPSSGVFSRADAQLMTIFDQELNRAYKVNQRRAEFRKILGVLLADSIGEGVKPNVA